MRIDVIEAEIPVIVMKPLLDVLLFGILNQSSSKINLQYNTLSCDVYGKKYKFLSNKSERINDCDRCEPVRHSCHIQA